MKYANYKFNARSINNLGDEIQILAIDNVYRQMGIDPNEIVYIDMHDLHNYDGDYVILPVTLPLFDYVERGIAGRFSKKIVPVFLGFTLVKSTLEKEEIEYLCRHEPIGCRDERTLEILRAYGIESYLHGCITITFPRSKEGEVNPRGYVYLVDVDSAFLPHIPGEIMRSARTRTHLVSSQINGPKEQAWLQYEEYKRNARLVLTSRLHCALPCLAYGIPVILMAEKVSFRFSWLEKILPIYELNEVDHINWCPKVQLTKAHQDRVLSLTIKRLSTAFEKYNDLYGLSHFYEERSKHHYSNDFCLSIIEFIEKNWPNSATEGSYSFWGLTQSSEYIYDYVTSHYPNMHLSHVYDSFRTVRFKGLLAEKPDMISNRLDEFVIVTAQNAKPAAEELFEKIHKPIGTYCW